MVEITDRIAIHASQLFRFRLHRRDATDVDHGQPTCAGRVLLRAWYAYASRPDQPWDPYVYSPTQQAAAQDLPTYANFVVAGASGMSAWVFIHPADLIKTRMQLLGDAKKDATAVTVAKDLVRFCLLALLTDKQGTSKNKPPSTRLPFIVLRLHLLTHGRVKPSRCEGPSAPLTNKVAHFSSERHQLLVTEYMLEQDNSLGGVAKHAKNLRQ